MEIEYLSEEKQYAKILSNEEIPRIRDPIFRAIRQQYWNEQHKVFLDEHGVPDHMLEQVSDDIRKREMHEIAEYKRQLG